MQSLVKLPKPLSKQLFIQLIVLLFFLLGTFWLGVETWNIQHSCTPMLQPLDTSVLSECCDTTKCEPTKPKPKIDLEPEHKPLPRNLVAIGAASIATASLAIVGAPVAVVAGVGIAVWFIVNSAIKVINGN